WQVVIGPDRVTIHADRRCASCSPHAGSLEATAQCVVPQPPRTDSPHHRKNQPPPGAQQTSAFICHGAQVWRAVQRAEVRVDTIELTIELIELLDPQMPGRYARSEG